MLVALFRGNPDAFIDNNMNRMRADVVLSVPSADTAKGIEAKTAREVIQAQSADFGAYRQKLASAVPATKGEGPSRQAGGKVEATVEDRKQTAAPSTDKLTLSKGAAANKAAAEAADRISKEREKAQQAARVAELSRNVEELRRLSSAASGAASAPASKGPATAAAPAPSTPAVAVPAPAVPPVAAATPPAAPPTTAAPATPTAPTAPATPASMAAPAPMVASAPEPASAAAPVAAATASAAAPAPKRPTQPTAAPVEEPGFFGTLVEDNPWALGIAAAVVALLAGFGVYRFSRRSKKDSGETSFLESRLQPDSFFGASGGQRIDTRDAGGASSSMSYSLSQLDAIGDVDPVAEADVYLAYGRDLQAEEILKEAMRSNPERLAIRTKLLEVYAKRRDTKGFELLATQLFSLTSGQGEDWARAQELGRQVDPDNALYQPGGTPPAGAAGEAARVSEPLGASTMPQSVLPSPSRFEQANVELEQRTAADSASGVDLDLDLGMDHTAAPAASEHAPTMAATQPLPREPLEAAQAHPHEDPDATLDFSAISELPTEEPRREATASPASEFPMDFDLSAISLDLDQPGTQQPGAAPAQDAGADLSAIDFAAEEADGDPLSRKLELAEEFRQIGDMEGARDLLQEVISKASGALKTKAQTMLNDIA